jgi:hypothetical protein
MERHYWFTAALRVDDVINIVGSLLLGLVLVGVLFALFVTLKSRGSQPEPPMEGPALPPFRQGATPAPEALPSPVLEPDLIEDAPTDELPASEPIPPTLSSSSSVLVRDEVGAEPGDEP